MIVPKYAKIQSGIIDLIAKMRLEKGALLPTEKQLAEHFQVSIITIRRAVSELKEQNIVRKEQGRGTFVASDFLKFDRKKEILLLNIFDGAYASVPSVPPLSVMDSQELNRRGWSMSSLTVCGKPEKDMVDRLNGVHGIVAVNDLNDEWITLLKGLSIPVVICGAISRPSRNIPLVLFDYYKMAFRLTEFLLRQGADNIVLMPGTEDYMPSREMRAGLADALKANGKELNASLIFYSNSEMRTIERVKMFLEEHPEADAFLAESQAFIPLVTNLYAAMRHPLIGILSTKQRFGGICPNTWEGVFQEDIFMKSVDILLDLIHGKDVPLETRLEPQIPDL